MILPHGRLPCRNRYEYRLTEKGRDLQPVLLAMVAWGDKWGATAKHPPLQPSDKNGDPVELRIVNGRRTGRHERAANSRFGHQGVGTRHA